MVIRSVSEALRLILWNAYNADATTRDIVGNAEGITLLNPKQAALDSTKRVSLWLYQVLEDEFAKNQPMIPAEQPDPADPKRRHRDEFPPMALDLMYLLTPFAPTGDADHLLLGKALQTLYDNASVLVVDATADIAEELRIAFYRHTLEELTRIWDALNVPYRLSVCYKVRVARVGSGRRAANARVVELSDDYAPSAAVLS